MQELLKVPEDSDLIVGFKCWACSEVNSVSFLKRYQNQGDPLKIRYSDVLLCDCGNFSYREFLFDRQLNQVIEASIAKIETVKTHFRKFNSELVPKPILVGFRNIERMQAESKIFQFGQELDDLLESLFNKAYEKITGDPKLYQPHGMRSKWLFNQNLITEKVKNGLLIVVKLPGSIRKRGNSENDFGIEIKLQCLFAIELIAIVIRSIWEVDDCINHIKPISDET